MILKKGILRKTFLFSSLLIIFIVVLSFSILYLAMPGFYFYQKQQALDKNIASLILQLRSAADTEACAQLLTDFSDANNATALSFNEEGNLLPNLSTPFLLLSEDVAFTVTINSQPEEGEDASHLLIKAESNQWEDDGVTLRDERLAMRMFISSDASEMLTSVMYPVGSELIDHIMVNSTLQPIDEATDVILSLIPWLLVLCVPVGLVMTYFYAKRLTSPILKISGAALSMKRMEPGVTARVDTGDELGELSRNLDDLYAELMDSIETLQGEMEKVSSLERQKTELMQSASHELKTPIAALNGIVEGMIDNVGVYKDRDRYLGECKGLIDRLSGLVGEILHASRADLAGDEPVMEDIRISDLLEQIFAEQAVLIRERELRLEKEWEELTVTSDRTLLHRALANLVSNAVRYTQPGGSVRTTLTRGDASCLLTIENQCASIPKEVLPKLWEPFYTRSYSRDKSESGTGLGLYIVKRNLDRLQIPFALENGKMGLRVHLRFP